MSATHTNGLLDSDRERLEVVCNNASVALFIMDERQQCVYMNPAAELLTGFRHEEIRGRILHDCVHHTRPDGTPYPLSECPIDRAFPERNRMQGEETFVHKDGSFYPVAYTASPIRNDRGEAIGTVIEVRDVREEKKANETRERFLEVGTDMLTIARTDGWFAWVSPAWERVLGWTPAEMLSRPWIDFVHPDDISATEVERHNLEEGRSVFYFENRYRTRGGEYRWISWRVRPYKEGGVFVLYGAASDITDRRAAEERLKEADRRKDEFLATLAHELRNPLAPIRNGLEILKRTEDSARRSAVQSMMERQLSHMTRLIDDLLDVARITTGKVVLKRDKVPLQLIAANAIEATRSLMESAGHQFTFQKPERPIVVYGDTTRLSQVLINILNNAVKYTPAGGTVSLELTVEGEEAVIRVTDNGVGIPAEMLPRVFDMFAQVNQGLNRAQGGIGIGLALVKRLVSMHGGTVSVSSDGEGKGSTFVVRLPLLVREGCGEETAMPEAISRRSASSPTKRILIVDDNHDSADSLSVLAQLDGHTTATAYSGQAAVAKARDFKPDLVFLDIGLPEMDGYQVAQEIHRMTQLANVPIIAMTGWGAEKDKERAREAGFASHLTKPIDVEEAQRIMNS